MHNVLTRSITGHVEQKTWQGKVCVNGPLLHQDNHSQNRTGQIFPLWSYLIFVISFTQAGFLNSKVLHPKTTQNTHKLQQIPQKDVKYAVICVQSGKFYTGENFFTRAPPVVPVTNMRYGEPFISDSFIFLLRLFCQDLESLSHWILSSWFYFLYFRHGITWRRRKEDVCQDLIVL